MLRLLLILLALVLLVILARALRRAKSGVSQTNEPLPTHPRMSRKEALEVLGLREGASREAILTSYRKLISKVHPDSPGGSNYLASKLNQAKQTLLD